MTGINSLTMRLLDNVNVDNVDDKRYELIQQLAKDTIDRKVEWRPRDLVSMLVSLTTKTETILTYYADYKGMNITISDNFKGKIRIKATRCFTQKVVIDTFIPFKPFYKYGKRVGTSRSLTLLKLFKSVRYQVDGMVMAS